MFQFYTLTESTTNRSFSAVFSEYKMETWQEMGELYLDLTC